MTEQQRINNKDVWIKIEPVDMHRSNPDIIPTEYFTATYYLNKPGEDANDGIIIKNENNEPELFESPVAALSFAEKELERVL